MTLKEVMAELERAGTAQNRKVYARHGYSDNMFGVSFANLRKLGKKIKRDDALARKLWATGNEDARQLACMIADPEAMTSADLDAWVSEIGHYCLADVFSKELAARSPHVGKKISAWTRSKTDFTGQAGWDLVALFAMEKAATPDATFEKHLATIERRVHSAPNRTRHAMNGALIAIGLRNAKLEKLALAAAARIGRVEVDHGATGCKTPDAAAYIAKASARVKKRKP